MGCKVSLRARDGRAGVRRGRDTAPEEPSKAGRHSEDTTGFSEDRQGLSRIARAHNRPLGDWLDARFVAVKSRCQVLLSHRVFEPSHQPQRGRRYRESSIMVTWEYFSRSEPGTVSCP